MNDHYFSPSPQSRHRYAEARFVYRGQQLAFTTDSGVFSRGEVDAGTQTLLRSLPEAMAGRVLDLGCGWGAVGVCVGKRYPQCDIVSSDVNSRALELTRQNAAQNGVALTACLSDGLDAVEGDFDYIITNPPIRAGKQTIYRLFAQSAQRLTGQGEMYLVIRRQQGAESAVRFLKTVFPQVYTIEKSGGFWVIRCRKGSQNEI